MKKAKFPAIAATTILCYIFWMLITGQIVSVFCGEASAEVLIAGAAVSILVALFSARFFIHDKAFFLYNPAKFLRLLFYYVIIFMWELIKANVNVAFKALSPKLKVKPGIVKIPVNVESEYGQSMVANSITLTPGTITMDAVEEKGKTYFYVHWIDVAETDHEKAGEAIKGTMEKWIGRIWK